MDIDPSQLDQDAHDSALANVSPQKFAEFVGQLMSTPPVETKTPGSKEPGAQ